MLINLTMHVNSVMPAMKMVKFWNKTLLKCTIVTVLELTVSTKSIKMQQKKSLMARQRKILCQPGNLKRHVGILAKKSRRLRSHAHSASE